MTRMPELVRALLRDHWHCPERCDKPQPFHHPTHGYVCGRCWFKFGDVSHMVCCTPETCPEDFA